MLPPQREGEGEKYSYPPSPTGRGEKKVRLNERRCHFREAMFFLMIERRYKHSAPLERGQWLVIF